MRYFINYADDGRVTEVGIGLDGIEITQSEYEEQAVIIDQKNELMNELYRGEITENDIPAEWRDEVVTQTEQLIAYYGEYHKDDVDAVAEETANEALAILRGEDEEA